MKIYGGMIAHAHGHSHHDGGATAQLQRQLTTLQSHLEHASAALPHVRRLCETSRLENTQYFPYTTTPLGDGDDMASLESRMQEMLTEVERLQCEATQRMRQREQRRESLVIKMEPMEPMEAHEGEDDTKTQAKGYDTDETDDELLLIKMMEHVDADDDGDGTGEPMEDQRDLAPMGAAPAVVTPRAVDSGSEKGQHPTETMATVSGGGVTAHQGLQAQLEELKLIVIAADKAHCHVRASKSRGNVATATSAKVVVDRETLQHTLDSAMDTLLQIGMTLEIVPSVLRLRDVMLHVRHATLKTTLSSPIQILHGLISSLPETIGGLPHTCRSLTRDGVAQELFAAAVDLLTTTSQRRRTELVDHVLRELKSGFKPSIVVRKVPSKHQKHQQKPRKDDQDSSETKWTVPWEGRVLLLVAHIVAYVITTHEPARMERFQGVLRLISARHALFPVLLERSQLIVMKPPLPCRDRTRTPRLHLKHEAQRILQICASACAE